MEPDILRPAVFYQVFILVFVSPHEEDGGRITDCREEIEHHPLSSETVLCLIIHCQLSSYHGTERRQYRLILNVFQFQINNSTYQYNLKL